jgi:hypothetical protein
MRTIGTRIKNKTPDNLKYLFLKLVLILKISMICIHHS